MTQRPQNPTEHNTPGLRWRKYRSGWKAIWVADRPDIIAAGFTPKSRRLWPPTDGEHGTEPQPLEWAYISSQCTRLQHEMLNFNRVRSATYQPEAKYDGTLQSAIDIYLSDPDSPYQKLRHISAKHALVYCRVLGRAVGTARLAQVKYRDLLRWHERFAAPKIEGGPRRPASAHDMMTMLRRVLSFGVALELEHCDRVQTILREMKFPGARKRREFLTAEQVIAIRREAHHQGLHSIALCQALLFELMWRPKDALGEWIPEREPGISEYVRNGRKWMLGVRWSEVDGHVLTHRLSKSIRGRDAIMDPRSGQTEEYFLPNYPMIMEDMARIPAEQRVGPMIISEKTGRPWNEKEYQKAWRQIARTCGIPDGVQNRDSRAGGITEAANAGAPLDMVRRAVGHADVAMTARYSRSGVEDKGTVHQLRVKSREVKRDD